MRSGQRNTRHKTHLDGFPPTVRVVRARHAWEGQPLELMGWMCRRGRLELILVLPDGSHLMVPAAWTDLRAMSEPAGAGTLGSLEDLLATRRILEPVLERVVLTGRDDPGRAEIDLAVATGTGGKSGARGGVVGVGRRASAADRDDAAGRDDRSDDRARGGRR